MGEFDDLIREYVRRLPEHVVTATNLWIGYEEGRQGDLVELKRLLHTVKGEAHMLGLSSFGNLAEILEDLVVRVQRLGAAPAGLGDAILEGFDTLAVLAATSTPEGIDVAAVIASLESALAEAPEPSTSVAPPAGAGEKAGPPGLDRDDGVPASPEVPELDGRAENVMRVEEVQPSVHELRRLYGEQQLLLPRLREVQRILRAIVAEMDPTLPPAVLGEQVIKTLGYAGEVERRLSAIGSEWSSNSFATGMALDQLGDATRKASVVSVGKLRSQLERAARTTARAIGKDVELRIEGDAYIDAAIARRLEPALLHAVRNAVDHGIELPDVRIERGKPARGKLKIRIEQQVSTVRVVVQDDGGGVDIPALRSRLGADESVPEQTLLARLFESGLSTRSIATPISGRGVGLDVVAREVSAVGGSYAVESIFGQGFKLVLRMPTVLRADVVVPIAHRGIHLAIPGRNVETFVRLHSLEQTTGGVRLRFTHHDETAVIPVYTLGPIFGEESSPSEGSRAVIVAYEGFRFALAIDEYEGPRTLPFQPSSDLAARSRVVQGIAPTPDGGVRMLLDVPSLVETLRGTKVEVTRRERRAEREVLVVEDAPVARELLCGILRSFGLRVTEAAHGREGLEALKKRRPHLVLTDVEMPFIGGLEMIDRIRHERDLADLPIIVLTTDTSEATRRRAQALGVAGFLAKQKFVESELRELVDRCLERR
ncbi:MAG: response regulator [Polyangiaceae bacterium]|nr:response regulator [Polyangiaceae bacterium]